MSRSVTTTSGPLSTTSGGSDPDVFCTRAEWKISNISSKIKDYPKGQSFWSPDFVAAGIRNLQLEFYPCGRESTSIDGFCSLFLWCPENTHVKYSMCIGTHQRAPDEDIFETRMGHGHSNFCFLAPEIDSSDDSVLIRVEIIDVRKEIHFGQGLKVVRPPLSEMIERYTAVLANRHLGRVEWRIPQISKRLKNIPKGASIYSPVFSVAGIRDMMMEFYPKGNANTNKEGFCSLYLRCPEGTHAFVSMSVGDVKKGPISARFDGSAGKGLPDFCQLSSQVLNDSVTVAIEIRNPANETSPDGTPLSLII